MYKVTRHGGRSSDKERVLYEGDIIKEAYSIFDDAVIKARQGTIRLYMDDILVRKEWLPRLRRIW